MDQPELIEFLKNNLTIATETELPRLGTGNRKTTITISVAGEDVCSDCIYHT